MVRKTRRGFFSIDVLVANFGGDTKERRLLNVRHIHSVRDVGGVPVIRMHDGVEYSCVATFEAIEFALDH